MYPAPRERSPRSSVSGRPGLVGQQPEDNPASRLADEHPPPDPPFTSASPSILSSAPHIDLLPHSIAPVATPLEIASDQRGIKRRRSDSSSDDETERGLHTQDRASILLSGPPSVHPSKRSRGGGPGSDHKNMRLDGKEQASATLSGPLSNGSGQPAGSSNPLKGAVASFTNGSSTNGESNGHNSPRPVVRPTGPFFGHDREEVARILIQSLTDLGYHGAATALSRESGFELENTSVAAFRNAIQEGEWAEAEALLFGSTAEDDMSGPSPLLGKKAVETSGWQNEGKDGNAFVHVAGLPLAEGANKREMLFLIRQQKYLELLEDRDLGTALSVLRQEITPLHQDTARLHSLSSLMMCPSAEDLRTQSRWDGAAGDSRNQLLSELSTSIAPSVMIPEHRLAVLFDQVQQNQINECLYHNTNNRPSLYHDHVCDRADFPLEQLTELHDHTDEVWHIAFSPSGSYLATASSNNTIFVYNTSDWRPLYQLTDQPGVPDVYGICYLSWSPDDSYLISCSLARQLTVYNIGDGGRRVQTLDSFSHPVSSAVWLPDGRSFIVGSQDAERSLDLYTLGESQPAYSFTRPSQNIRIRDCAVSADGFRLAVITTEKHVLIYDLKSSSRSQLADFTMDEQLTCIDLSPDGSQLLLSMNNSQLRLVDSVTGNFLQHYQGMKQTQYVVRASFGGADQGFVISGSEDSHIYIHRRHSGALVAAIPAHSPVTINCVAWHPSRPGLFASAGDDRKVKIWASAAEVVARQRPGQSTRT